jgi:tRNA(fMet)-specific endonuclease VapC
MVKMFLGRSGRCTLTPIGAIDTLIAGVALSLDATLVTHNTREFSRVPNLEIVDWF